MEALNKSVQDLMVAVTAMHQTVSALGPLVPHEAELAAILVAMKKV
uniref:Uncharacterized protein n=1 Tax=Arundo donax TaxID=35708 RepID=A0A0A9BR53_ARUDO